MPEDKTYYRVDFRSKTPLDLAAFEVIAEAQKRARCGVLAETLQHSGRRFDYKCVLFTGDEARNILIVEKQ